MLRRQLAAREQVIAWPCDRRKRTYISAYPELNAINAFFRLGTAEYRVGQLDAAYGHWYRALAGGHAYDRGAAFVVHFDSVLARHLRQPLLLPGRAIAHLSNYDYATTRQQSLEKALTDLDQAQAIGYAAADVPYYQVLIFKEQQRYIDMRRALALDAAIALLPTAGELYELRVEARAALGEAAYNATRATDPDWIAYQRLCPDGR